MYLLAFSQIASSSIESANSNPSQVSLFINTAAGTGLCDLLFGDAGSLKTKSKKIKTVVKYRGKL